MRLDSDWPWWFFSNLKGPSDITPQLFSSPLSSMGEHFHSRFLYTFFFCGYCSLNGLEPNSSLSISSSRLEALDMPCLELTSSTPLGTVPLASALVRMPGTLLATLASGVPIVPAVTCGFIGIFWLPPTWWKQGGITCSTFLSQCTSFQSPKTASGSTIHGMARFPHPRYQQGSCSTGELTRDKVRHGRVNGTLTVVDSRPSLSNLCRFFPRICRIQQMSRCMTPLPSKYNNQCDTNKLAISRSYWIWGKYLDPS